MYCTGTGNPRVFGGFFHGYGYGYKNSDPRKTRTRGHGSRVFATDIQTPDQLPPTTNTTTVTRHCRIPPPLWFTWCNHERSVTSSLMTVLREEWRRERKRGDGEGEEGAQGDTSKPNPTPTTDEEHIQGYDGDNAVVVTAIKTPVSPQFPFPTTNDDVLITTRYKRRQQQQHTAIVTSAPPPPSCRCHHQVRAAAATAAYHHRHGHVTTTIVPPSSRPRHHHPCRGPVTAEPTVPSSRPRHHQLPTLATATPTPLFHYRCCNSCKHQVRWAGPPPPPSFF